MPKSKRKRARYIPRQQSSQKPIATAAPQPSITNPPSARPAPVATPSRTARVAVKGPPADQLKYVSTELKVVGILTFAIIAAIVILYFVLR